MKGLDTRSVVRGFTPCVMSLKVQLSAPGRNFDEGDFASLLSRQDANF